MDLPYKKIDKWTLETAQMKHSARKYSCATVADSYLRKFAAECGIEDYKIFLVDMSLNSDMYSTVTEEQRNFSDISSSVGVWATIAGCIKPYINIDEWLGFDDKTVEKLATAAQELNSHWFIQPEQEKKTDELPMIHIQESET
jgi:hypothetical protein